MLRVDARQKLTWEKLSGNRYLAHAVFGKAGLPLKYFNWDGNQWKQRIETVTADELFRDDSLLSARATPILLGHPPKGRYNNNESGLLVGHTFDSFIREDDQLILPVVVDDLRGTRIIDQAIDNSQCAEVSPGYGIQGLKQRADGTFEQIGRQYDHLALLLPGRGRGGQFISLRTDELSEIAGAEKQFFFIQKNMKQVNIDGVKFEIEDEHLADAIIAQQNRVDSLEKDKNRFDGEIAGLRIRCDELELKKPSPEEQAADRKDYLQTRVLVEPYLRQDSSEFDPDYKMSPLEMKTAYLLKAKPELKPRIDSLSGASLESFVSGAWEYAQPKPKSKGQVDIERTDAQFDLLDSGSDDREDMGGDDFKVRREKERKRKEQNGVVVLGDKK